MRPSQDLTNDLRKQWNYMAERPEYQQWLAVSILHAASEAGFRLTKPIPFLGGSCIAQVHGRKRPGMVGIICSRNAL